MTELEQQLSDGLRKLAAQYEQDMQRLAAQNLQLREQVQSLAAQAQTLAGQVQTLAGFLAKTSTRLTELLEQ